ncbi:MAG TPA: MiaB/RimO family radical SAM methylthiotransferase [Candidatus Limnocylindrales bacterium]|nr:MiaB/RimO family radical SAM methylthiotransferase [Candidatus Limnocylindrales bacterium]
MALRGPTAPTAAISNLGCKVNQSELEGAVRHLRERGVRFGNGDGVGGGRVDLHVVNTCTVTAEADAKSRAAVRRARRANPDATVVVTGCSVSISPETYAAIDPAAIVIDNASKRGLGSRLEALLGLGSDGAPLDGPLPTMAGPELVSAADRRSVADRTRAFVKVQDGCSFFCTYCLIPRARGAERSLPPDAIVVDVRRAVAAGHREVVLTGINIGTYDGGSSERGYRGSHVRAALTLAGLVRRILGETSVERLRLSSIEPQHVDDGLLSAWRDGAPRTLPHLHLPLQSGDDGVLRRMGRRYDTAAYAAVVDRARIAIPGLALHADVMAGFPSEDEAAHERTLGFLGTVEPAGLHVFRYSERPGTAALRMTGVVDAPTRKRRAADLLRLAADARGSFTRRAVGHERRVLFEDREPDGRWVGRAEDYVEVAVGGAGEMANVVGRVWIERIDPSAPDRAVGRLLVAV